MSNAIAHTIYNQIKAAGFNIVGSWGAREYVLGKDSLKFKVSGQKFKGYVHVKYDHGRDLYNIDFFKIVKFEIRYNKQIEGVYADQLVEIIDNTVETK